MSLLLRLKTKIILRNFYTYCSILICVTIRNYFFKIYSGVLVENFEFSFWYKLHCFTCVNNRKAVSCCILLLTATFLYVCTLLLSGLKHAGQVVLWACVLECRTNVQCLYYPAFDKTRNKNWVFCEKIKRSLITNFPVHMRWALCGASNTAQFAMRR